MPKTASETCRRRCSRARAAPSPPKQSNPKQPAAVILFLISNVDGKEERAMHMFRCEAGTQSARWTPSG